MIQSTNDAPRGHCHLFMTTTSSLVHVTGFLFFTLLTCSCHKLLSFILPIYIARVLFLLYFTEDGG